MSELLRGASVLREIDITPTWVGVLPVLLAAIQNGTPEGQRLATIELTRMAQAADAANRPAKAETAS